MATRTMPGDVWLDGDAGTRDPFDLARFVVAQEGAYGSYADALAEMRAGRKETHWIWYVFPQLRELGTSRMSRRYGISGLDEAVAYLSHPLLGQRLVEVSQAALGSGAGDPLSLMSSQVDAAKLRSSMTLFSAAAGEACRGPASSEPPVPAGAEQVFDQVLERLFAGERDPITLLLLGERGQPAAYRPGSLSVDR